MKQFCLEKKCDRLEWKGKRYFCNKYLKWLIDTKAPQRVRECKKSDKEGDR